MVSRRPMNLGASAPPTSCQCEIVRKIAIIRSRFPYQHHLDRKETIFDTSTSGLNYIEAISLRLHARPKCPTSILLAHSGQLYHKCILPLEILLPNSPLNHIKLRRMPAQTKTLPQSTDVSRKTRRPKMKLSLPPSAES